MLAQTSRSVLMWSADQKPMTKESRANGAIVYQVAFELSDHYVPWFALIEAKDDVKCAVPT